jgi:hypothetical protein
MSNRVDFFQPEQTSLSLPCAAVSVFVEGILCPHLEVAEVVRGEWSEFGWVRLVYNPAAYAGEEPCLIEDIEAELGMGRQICIRQIYNGAAPEARAFSCPIFIGQIESIKTTIGPDGETAEIIAKDFSAVLGRITVYGRQVSGPGNTSVFLAGLDTVFNEDGKANATIEVVDNEGDSYRLFCAEPSQGTWWSYADAIEYLLCEYLPAGQLHRPDIARLRAITENQIVRDLDVTGLSLLEALHRCCERIGLKFKFVSRPVPTGPEQAIVFYRNGQGRSVELNCQQPSEQLSISKTSIAGIRSRKNLWPVTHRYIGQGDFKAYEASFDLVKAWDSSLESTDYDTFSPSTNPQFHQVKDVYRKWCLNEAGDYTAAPYNRGQAFDFSKIFETSDYAHRRRRFLPALSADKQGKSLGYFLQVSYEGGARWWQYLYAFNILVDECGIWLSSDRLDVNTWIAALKGQLRFRITASVVSDERISCIVADGPVNSTAPVVDHVAVLPRQFKFRKVSNKSIFKNASDESLGAADEVDDSTSLHEFVRKTAAAGSEVIETIDLQTPYVCVDYEIGDRVTMGIDGRDLIGCRRDNRSIAWVERVQMDYTGQCTNLKIARRRRVFL